MSSVLQLQERLDRYARIPLAEYPTPLERLPRLSAHLGREIYIKRDDGIGPGLGGNKTRKLEYLLAEARQRGFRKVVTFGGLQSNHARLTAAAACKLGFEPHLLYFEPRPREMTGNLLLNQVCGAHIYFIPFGGGGGMSLEASNRLAHLVALLFVGRHYFIPVGGHTWLGCLGYARAALEIQAQADALGIGDAHLVTAAGTGGTLAGLLAGLRLTGSSLRPLGIDVGKLWKGFPVSLARLTTEICRRLGEERNFKAEDIPLLENVYAAPKYGQPSPGCVQAIHTLARMEGILLDPVYTGKAFGGLLDLMERGSLGGRDEPVIFLHTGGLPALFAFEERILNHA
ncbi:MAG: 1-aminocyclopropane-1-carboxylate deaminase/D-cysteine desulfhydrase [Chloroflexota bacterium]